MTSAFEKAKIKLLGGLASVFDELIVKKACSSFCLTKHHLRMDVKVKESKDQLEEAF